MSLLTDAIAAELATLSRVVDAPTGVLGFGTDLSCTTDLRADFGEIDGSSPLAVAESCFRRLGTPRGSLVDDPDYGFDVIELLHKGLTKTEILALEGQVRNELLKDDRIVPETFSVVLTVLAVKTFDLEIRGETASGPFSLTLALVDGETLLKEMAA